MPTDALTVEQLRAVDRFAIDTLGLPMAVLMENAGLNAASVVIDRFAETAELDRDRFVAAVFCGAGNNGGDGYVVARHLAGFGIDVRLFATREPDPDRAPAAAMNARVCRALAERGVLRFVTDPVAAAADTHAVIDAIAGVGLAGALRAPEAAAVAALNGAREGSPPPAVIALDLPSGLDADRGEATGPCVTADLTVTFTATKVGFDRPSAAACLGHVLIADIGVPDAVIAAAVDAAGL